MEFQKVYDEAVAAGMTAANACKPVPMIVGSSKSLFGNDVDPNQPTYFVAGGVCGFAWINVSPATQPFARWLKKTGKVRAAGYYGGYQLSASVGGQSMRIKEAYAQAFADVLKAAGVKAYSQSRMD